MPRVDAVVFDIGNVLIRWDPRFLYRDLIPDEARREWFLTEVCSSAWNHAQDLGRPWDEAIAERVARFPAEAALIRAYRERWHEMVPGAIDGSVALLEQLDRAGVPLYALTNFAADTYAETQARFPFLRRFRDVLVSGIERIGKPDLEAYRRLLERNGLEPRRCVFVDDIERNVAGARAAGLEGRVFVSPEALAADLRALGLPVEA